MEINELKNIWKTQKAGNINANIKSYDSLIDGLRKNEKHVLKKYIIMSFFMLAAFNILLSKIFSIKQYEPLTYTGFYLILISMTAMFILLWSNIIFLGKKTLLAQNTDFLEKIQVKLKRRRIIRKIALPVYLLLISTGITFVFIEILRKLDTLPRVALHLGVIVFILGISYIASRKENKRYNEQLKPLERKINSIINTQ